MPKFLLGVLSGVLLVFFLIGAVFLLLVMASGSSAPGVANDSVLEIYLSGDLPEHVSEDVSFASLQGRTPVTLLTVLKAIEKAALDDRISALEIELDGLQVGWAKAQEVRWAIEKFRDSDKPVYAYLVNASTIDYYVASAADDLRSPPESVLDVKGLRAEVAFYKDLFEKVGVDIEMERIGKFKSAAEPYSRSSMSDEFRQVLDAMLDEYMKQFLDGVAPRRNKTTEELRALLDEGPFLPDQAVEAGLIDGLTYPDEQDELIRNALVVDELNKVTLSEYVRSGAIQLEQSSTNRIAVLYGVGSIMRSSGGVFGGDSVLSSDDFNETVRQLRDDDSIDAVVLRIDSPGGDAIASDDMWRELNLLADEKPIVVSMSDVAASGGYYMAMIKDAPVLAYPGTVTGSIGVFFGKVNLRGLYDKIGLKKEILTRGRFAAIDSDYLPLGDAERVKLREGIEHIYHGFVSKVADARGKEYDAIHEVAQGHVWLGVQALENGLVDELGGFERAIALAKERSGIKEDDDVSLVVYPSTKNLLEILFEDGSFPQAKLSFDGFDLLKSADRNFPALLQGGMLAVTPYALSIR
ncbi:MAG: signal peptide peptidase SppA [Acidobacteria bacterium]|nr:signal peptide peptidase SppA [Acidobacteriota bacterium]MDA1235295.1 signal peptide peptidase SppA [Acidobacteriota bacterium]